MSGEQIFGAFGLAVCLLALASIPLAIWADLRAERAHQAEMDASNRRLMTMLAQAFWPTSTAARPDTERVDESGGRSGY